jgi:hypothetical protein
MDGGGSPIQKNYWVFHDLAGSLSPSAGRCFLFASLQPSGSRKDKDAKMTVKRIETGTPEGDALGFFEKLFSGWLEKRDDNRLYLHYIISRNRNEGNTQALLRRWLSDGYDVRVVMPRPVMQHILRKYQFIPSREYFPEEYEDKVEVWARAGFRQS